MKEFLEKTKSVILQERTTWILLSLVLLLMILPGLNAFPYPGNGQPYSDYATTHYPYARYLIDSIKEYGQIPLWSNQIYSGMPFFSNPQAGIWYPLYWIGYLFPLPAGFMVIIALHLGLAVWGMKKFLGLMDIEGIPALAGTTAFVLMPKLWAHYGAGHLTLFCAICLLPWLLYLSAKQDRPWYLAWLQPGLVLALIFLVASQWVIYAGLLWAAWVLLYRNEEFWKRLLYLLGQGMLASLLAMPLWLPLLEFVGYSSRQALEVSDNLNLSLPWGQLISLVLPTYLPSHEFVIFPGILALLLALANWLDNPNKAKTWFWWTVILLSFLLALGDNLPWNAWLFQLPGFSLLRVPTRALFLSGFALSVLAAIGLRFLLSRDFKQDYALRLVGMAVVAAALVLSTIIFLAGGEGWLVIILNVLILAGGLLWILFKDWLKKPWAYGLLLFLAAELVFSSVNMFQYRDIKEVFSEGAEAAEFINRDQSTFRVYSPSYSIPEQTAVEYGIELADGNDPLQLEDYLWFMEIATGIPVTEYSPTIPPFEVGGPAEANQFYLPDIDQLGRINVKYIAAAFPIDLPELILQGEFDNVYVYENPLVLPRAYVLNGEEIREAEVVVWSPNHVEIIAEGPGSLILAEVNYTGWEVSVDGEEADLDLYLVRKLELGEGSHTVVMDLKPLTLKYGIAAGVLGLLILTGLAGWVYLDQREEPDGK